MKAVVIRELGPAEVLTYEHAPDPVTGPDDVLIRVEVISIEGGDLLNRTILAPPGFPHIIGYQAAGVVEAIGEKVSGIRVGQRVVGFNFFGSYAEKFCVVAHHAFPIPDSVDIRVAATIPVPFGTADDALFEFGRLCAGETVFIQGGAGGVGLAAIQLAKAAGATVIATARGAARAARLKDYGADHGIPYDEVDFVDEVLRLTGNKGADLVVDMAGGNAEAISRLIKTVSYRGRLSIVGAASREVPSISFSDIIHKNLTVYGILFGAEMHTPRAHKMLARHLESAAAGKLSMPIDREFPLAQAIDAHRYIENSRPFGRVLLIPG